MRPVDLVRRGTLYGAAVGLLLGLVAVALQNEVGRDAISTWRNWILACACIGLIASFWRVVRQRRLNAETVDEPPSSP